MTGIVKLTKYQRPFVTYVSKNAETLRDREETSLSDIEKDFLYLDTLTGLQIISDERNSRVWPEWARILESDVQLPLP